MRQCRSTEDRETGKQLAPLWKELAEQLKVLFPDGDDEGAFIIPTLDARPHVVSIKDRRNGVGKPVFKLVSLGSGQTLTLVTPVLSVTGISPDVLRVLSQANTMCDGRPFASSPCCCLACRGALLRGFPFRWVLHFVLSLTCGSTVHDSASCSREVSLDECGILSPLFSTMAAEQPIHLGAGDPISQGLSYDLFQDAPD